MVVHWQVCQCYCGDLRPQRLVGDLRRLGCLADCELVVGEEGVEISGYFRKDCVSESGRVER